MLAIRDICKNTYNQILNYKEKNFDNLNNFFVNNLNKSWNIKKTLHKNMTNSKIEEIIKIVNSCCESKVGIKLLGAGAGGFVIVSGIKNMVSLQKNLHKKKLLFFNASIDTGGSVFI